MNITGLLGLSSSSRGVDLGGMVEKLRSVSRTQGGASDNDARKASPVASAQSAAQGNDIKINQNPDGSITIVESLTDPAGRAITRSRTVSRDNDGMVFVHEQMQRPGEQTAAATGPGQGAGNQSNGILYQVMHGSNWNSDGMQDPSLYRSAPLISLIA